MIFKEIKEDLNQSIKELTKEELFFDSDVVNPFRISIYIPYKNFAIQLNENEKVAEIDISSIEARKSQLSKTQACLAKNIRLLHIFENNWIEKKKQILSFIRSSLGLNEIKIHGRECKIVEDLGKQLLNDTHIQGYGHTTIKSFNLIKDGDWIGCMTASKHHRQNGGNSLVLNRLCFKNGITVSGGASKLFESLKNWGIQNGYSDIVSWSDTSWTVGKIYEILSFSMKNEYGPDYFYWDKVNNDYLSKQSQKKSNNGCPADITEHKWCRDKGLYRIYDCGKKCWNYQLQNSQVENKKEISMSMAQNNQQIFDIAQKESQVWKLAAECIQKIDSAGGIGCNKDGVFRVAHAMLKIIESNKKDQMT